MRSQLFRLTLMKSGFYPPVTRQLDALFRGRDALAPSPSVSSYPSSRSKRASQSRAP